MSKVIATRLPEEDNISLLKMAAMHGVASTGDVVRKIIQQKTADYRLKTEMNIARMIYDLSMPNNNQLSGTSEMEMQASRSLVRDENNHLRDEGFPNSRILQLLRGEQRDMSMGLAENYGSDLVGTNTDPSRYRILKETTLTDLGIEIQQHFGQNLTIPIVTADGVAGWEPTEGAGVTEGTPATDMIELTPKFANSYHERTRAFLLSSGPSAHDKIIEAIASDINNVLIDGLFNGTGADGEPEGLDNNSDVQSVDGTDFTLTKALTIVKTSHNAKFSNNKKWCMNFNTFATLGERDFGTDTGQKLIQMVNGKPYMSFYPVILSSKVADNQVFYGDFSANTHLVVFGEAINLFVRKAPISGIRQFDASLPVDIAFQNPTSFIKSTIS